MAPVEVAPVDVAAVEVAPVDVAPVDVAAVDVAPVFAGVAFGSGDALCCGTVHCEERHCRLLSQTHRYPKTSTQ